MAMRILPDFLMSSSASALATWLMPIIAEAATAMARNAFFIVSSTFLTLRLSACVHVGELCHAPAELFCGREFRVEIGRDQVLGEPRSDDLRADAQHVDVVVLDALMGRVNVVADRRTDALHLVGPDRGA